MEQRALLEKVSIRVAIQLVPRCLLFVLCGIETTGILLHTQLC